ncbi:hypothetical protein, partial [Diplocloster modestus]
GWGTFHDVRVDGFHRFDLLDGGSWPGLVLSPRKSEIFSVTLGLEIKLAFDSPSDLTCTSCITDLL